VYQTCISNIIGLTVVWYVENSIIVCQQKRRALQWQRSVKNAQKMKWPHFGHVWLNWSRKEGANLLSPTRGLSL